MSLIEQALRFIAVSSIAVLSIGPTEGHAESADGGTSVELAHPGEPGMGSDPSRSPLLPGDAELLQAQRAVIERFMTEDERKTYGRSVGKLSLIARLLEKGVFGAEDTWELQCLGVVLGDALALEPELHWVAYEDEYGRDAVLQFEDTSIVIFPITMISKRIERDEDVDVHQLFELALEEVHRMRESGNYE